MIGRSFGSGLYFGHGAGDLGGITGRMCTRTSNGFALEAAVATCTLPARGVILTSSFSLFAITSNQLDAEVTSFHDMCATNSERDTSLSFNDAPKGSSDTSNLSGDGVDDDDELLFPNPYNFANLFPSASNVSERGTSTFLTRKEIDAGGGGGAEEDGDDDGDGAPCTGAMSNFRRMYGDDMTRARAVGTN